MAVKRRVIWMDDEDWKWIRDAAESEGMTVSGFLRAATAMAITQPLDTTTKALFGPSGLDEGLTAFRAELAKRAEIRLNHDRPIGKVTKIVENERGVTIIGERYDQRPVRAVPKHGK